MTVSDLLPCPFCRSVPAAEKHRRYDLWRMTHVCPAVGEIAINWREAEAEIAGLWNMRGIEEAGVVVNRNMEGEF